MIGWKNQREKQGVAPPRLRFFGLILDDSAVLWQPKDGWFANLPSHIEGEHTWTYNRFLIQFNWETHQNGDIENIKEGFDKTSEATKTRIIDCRKIWILDRSESTGPTGLPTIGSRHGKPGARPGDHHVENSAEFPPPISEFPPGRSNMAVCQNLVPLVNIKIAGKWMLIPLKNGINRYWSIPIYQSQSLEGPPIICNTPHLRCCHNWILLILELCIHTHMLHCAGIFTYIWVIFRVNVGKYSSTMEHMGYVEPNLAIDPCSPDVLFGSR